MALGVVGLVYNIIIDHKNKNNKDDNDNENGSGNREIIDVEYKEL